MIGNWLGKDFGSDLEGQLCCKLANRCPDDVTADNQVWVDCGEDGNFRVDLMLTHHTPFGDTRYAVEVDGRRFHNAEKDARRDKALLAHGVRRVIHVPAWKVWHNCDAAADEVIGMLPNVYANWKTLDGYEADWERYVAENRGEASNEQT